MSGRSEYTYHMLKIVLHTLNTLILQVDHTKHKSILIPISLNHLYDNKNEHILELCSVDQVSYFQRD